MHIRNEERKKEKKMCVWKQRSDILKVFPVPNLPAPSSALLRHIYEDWSVEWHVAGRHGYAGAGNSSYRWMNIPFVVAVGETQIHCREKAQPKLKIPYISSYFLSFSGSNYEYFICTFSSTSLTFFFFFVVVVCHFFVVVAQSSNIHNRQTLQTE